MLAPDQHPWLTRERLWLAGLLLFTIIVRSGVLWAMWDNLAADPDAYREIAENVLAHGVYGLGKDSPPTPTAFRPPLYPIVLSNLPAADGKYVSLFKVAALHILLGVATVWLTYMTARRIVGPSGPEGPALPTTSTVAQVGQGLTDLRCVAGLLIACDPILLNQQSLVMTETLATFLAILALWCLARFSDHRYWWNAGLAGGAIGLAALCRPTFLPWLGLVAVAMLISDFRLQTSDWKARLGRNIANLAALLVIAAAVISPWAIRNNREFGKIILTTTHGGYTLALGNNERFYLWLQSDARDTPWESKMFDEGLRFFITLDAVNSFLGDPHYDPVPINEIRSDKIAYDRAQLAMRENPRMCAVACHYRVRQLWSPFPNKLTADESTGRMLLRYVTAAWYCGVYLLAAIGVWRLRGKLLRQPWIWGVLLCLTFTAVHTLYWCNLRMRAPLMPFVALVAAAGVSTIKRSSG